MTTRTVTQSVESDVDPDSMLAILMDPRHLPQWAPAFADTIETDPQGGWRVNKNGRTFSLQVAIVQSSRTVDYLREVAPGQRGGAYLRVLPRPNGGSVIVMTLPIPTGGEAERVAAILSQELSNLTNLSEQQRESQQRNIPR